MPTAVDAPPNVWRSLRTRLDEPSTWAGIGGVLLVSLDLLPGAMPAFHAATSQHGWARVAALLLALCGFVVAVAKKENNARVVAIAEACAALVEEEDARAAPSSCAPPPRS